MGAAEKLEAHAVDLTQARTFLARLGKVFTFQTFDETSRKRPALNRVLHGSLAEHGSTLVRLNDQGAGVFVMVNAGDGKARKADNVQAVRAYFADLDGAPIEAVQAFEIAPHIIVESSPGRWHAYWIAADAPMAAFKSMQQAIAQRFGSDSSVCDLPRVMRLPGFIHRKGEPFLSRVLSINGTAAYTHAAMVDAFGLVLPHDVPAVASRTLQSIIPMGKRNSTLFDLACGLVRKGIPATGVNDRLQRINAERAQPPLCATEVDSIAARASGYGSRGFDRLPHALTDSPVWASLPSTACMIVLAFYRRFNGSNNGRLCVVWSDLQGKHGMGSSGAFYAHLRRIVDAGMLIKTVDSKRTQSGTAPAMYAIADEFLPSSRSARAAPSAEFSRSTIKQITALGSLSASRVSNTHGHRS